MKTVILAGGLGTRLSEETSARPKPMVEIGGMPLLWHIMAWYSRFDCTDFLIACGYKSEIIKEYFNSLRLRTSDLLVNLQSGASEILRHRCPDWNIRLIDTGLNTMTGGRLRRLKEYVGEKRFMLTYGDGVSDVNIADLLAFHEDHGRLATVTAVHPPARFGSLNMVGDVVSAFEEKPQTGEGWINGGFFVMEPEVLDYIDSDATVLEREPLERLARDRQLMACRHHGFWQPMDTLRDKRLLEQLWESGQAPWRTDIATPTPSVSRAA